MRNIIVVNLALLCLGTQVSGSAVDISGRITASQSWDVDTLNVTGNVTFELPDSTEMVIQPGTVVLFHGNYKMTFTNSSVKVSGTPEDSIRFVPADTVSSWGGIDFNSLYYSPNDGDIPDDTISFSYLVFNGKSRTGGPLMTIQTKQRGLVQLTGCSFRNGSYEGLLLYFYDQSPVIIQECTFTGNRIGIMSRNTERLTFGKNVFQIEGCRFSGQTEIAVRWEMSSCLVNGSTFEGNNTGDEASCFYHIGRDERDTVWVENSSFTANNGGPCVIVCNSVGKITGNTFRSNSAHNILGGAALYCNPAFDALISHNLFIDNSITADSGDGDAYGAGSALFLNIVTGRNVVSNNLIVKNSTFWGGAVFLLRSDSVLFVNNTIADNVSESFSPAVYGIMSKETRFVNTCFHLNTAKRLDDSLVYQVHFEDSAVAYFNNCLFAKTDSSAVAEKCEGCLFEDPLFTDAESQEYTLENGSPCINRGDTPLSGFSENDTDLAGKPRISGDTVDIGAFEYQHGTILLTAAPQKSDAVVHVVYYRKLFASHRLTNDGYLLNGVKINDGRHPALRHQFLIVRKNVRK